MTNTSEGSMQGQSAPLYGEPLWEGPLVEPLPYEDDPRKSGAEICAIRQEHDEFIVGTEENPFDMRWPDIVIMGCKRCPDTWVRDQAMGEDFHA